MGNLGDMDLCIHTRVLFHHWHMLDWISVHRCLVPQSFPWSEASQSKPAHTRAGRWTFGNGPMSPSGHHVRRCSLSFLAVYSAASDHVRLRRPTICRRSAQLRRRICHHVLALVAWAREFHLGPNHKPDVKFPSIRPYRGFCAHGSLALLSL
jgi:hypothetical protein